MCVCVCVSRERKREREREREREKERERDQLHKERRGWSRLVMMPFYKSTWPLWFLYTFITESSD